MAELVTILIPVYNDALSLNRLLQEMSEPLKEFTDSTFRILLIDDGSTEALTISTPLKFPLQILHLQRNLGHQKAITIGLAYINEHIKCDKVLVMDCDGEDRPSDAALLLKQSQINKTEIIFAKRKSRQEGKRFRFFYRIYKIAFRVLTGQKIEFGNFLLMPKPILEKAVYYSEIWNHIAAGILKTNLPYVTIVTHRGKRYVGNSKMNFTSLLIHGLGAIAVFIEVIASRLLIFSLLLIGISLLAMLSFIAVKTFTNLAIPGWTSTVVSATLIVLLQGFLLSLFTIFLYLTSQSQRKFIPALHYKDYGGTIETIQ
jgi:glycosyltransferase involved in cell wall biosynthesis